MSRQDDDPHPHTQDLNRLEDERRDLEEQDTNSPDDERRDSEDLDRG